MKKTINEIKEKATESINIRLNQNESDLLDKFAKNQTGSGAVNNILRNNGCFDYDVSDDDYTNLLKLPEINNINAERIPKNEIRIIRCRMTRNEKKSLFYFALEKHKISPSVFVKDLLRNVLFTGITQPQENNDILVKKLWVNVSDKTKKELVAQFLKSQNEII